MNFYVCDACGCEFHPKKDGEGRVAVGVMGPRNQERLGEEPRDILAALMAGGEPKPRNKPDEATFEFCYECALGMMVALKRQKADLRAGRLVRQ